MATLPADVTRFGARARDAGLIKPAGPTVKKTGGCESHTVEHADGPTVRLGGNSNQRMGAGVDSLVAAPGHVCRTDSVRATRQPVAAHDARSAFAPPSKGRGAYPKLLGTLLATVAAVPVALAMRGFRGTSSSPKTMGRVLVLLAMLSTASGWKLPQSEAPEMAMASTGEPHEATMDAITGEPHESPITGGVDGARDRRRLASGCTSGSDCDAGCAACAAGTYSAASTSLEACVPWLSRQAAHARAPCRAAAAPQAVAPPRAITHQPTVHTRAQVWG